MELLEEWASPAQNIRSHMITIREKTLYIPKIDLWIDSLRERERSYISHGHADHARPHGVVVTSPVNAQICEARFGRRGTRKGSLAPIVWETHAFNEPWMLDDHRLTLFPAGHVLGSAQLLVEGEDGSFVYTGDFKLEQAFTAETTEVKRCDVVLMECTYGKPHFAFPPRAEIAGAMVEFAHDTLEAGEIPVFFAYSLGKAQEAIAILGSGDIPLTVHSAIFEMSEIYQHCGIRLPHYRLYEDACFDGESAVIWPPSGKRLPETIHGKTVRTASLTGWSLGGGVYRPRHDRGFPLSDHADFPSLLKYVELAQPKKVLLNHGYKTFVEQLRKRGVQAEYLEEHGQLSLF